MKHLQVTLAVLLTASWTLGKCLWAAEVNVDPAVVSAMTAGPTNASYHEGDVSIDLRAKPIPAEIVEKLSPEQVFELYQMEIQKAQRGVTELPALATALTAIVFACPVAIVVVVMFFRHRRKAMLHKTLAAMIEKGVSIPEELLAPERTPAPSDLRRGIILVATGLGIVGFLLGQREEAWGLGLIPLLIGVGFLIVWKLDQRKQAG